MKIYISGPITGTTDYMERFAKAEEHLKSIGYDVVNPAVTNSKLPESTTWNEYMNMSMCMLRMCKAIYMLKGWSKSKGAKKELRYALDCDYEIYEEGNNEPENA